MLYDLRMNIKNYNPNIGYKNVDITIINFHILISEFYDHANTNKYLGHNWTKVIRNKKIEYHPLIDSPNKKRKRKRKRTNQNTKRKDICINIKILTTIFKQ